MVPRHAHGAARTGHEAEGRGVLRLTRTDRRAVNSPRRAVGGERMNGRKSYARWWTAIVSLGLLPLAAIADSASNTASIITIAQGSLRGSAEGSLHVFRGIPFAAPPVGEHRWRPPLPAAAWRGVRDATHFDAGSPGYLVKS